MLRLLICDDSAEDRERLRLLLAEQSKIEIVAEAEDGHEAVELAAELGPDVILIDVLMPRLDGIAATAQIRELLPDARIVALAASLEDDLVEAVLAAGADAYCVKAAIQQELEGAVGGAADPLVRLAHAPANSGRRVTGGRGEAQSEAPFRRRGPTSPLAVRSRDGAKRAVTHRGGRPHAAKATTLSPAEFEALVSAALGESVQEAAQRLFKSPWTIRTQRNQVMAKLDATNMAHAVFIAAKRGIL